MKKLIRNILNKCLSIPIPIRIYSLIDLYSSFAQGLGWGSGTIKQEINACLSLLRTKPNIFIDIGANKGLYTQGVINQIGSIETHVFEPSELNYEILKDKFSFSN